MRGRIRFDEQIRRRFGLLLPVEVRYDEFTDDILANRLVRAAAARLGGMRLRPRARTGLGRVMAMLDNVSPEEFPPNAVPEVRFDRLNEHYREVVALSRLVLRHGAFESRRGQVRASGFLMDMNVVFQEFVTVALRETLRVSDRVFLEKTIGSLDEADRVRLRPDLTWWLGGECVFVGDAKYKRVTVESVPNADLYQLLAYVTALDLPGGLLVYAQGRGGHGGASRSALRQAAGGRGARPVRHTGRGARPRRPTGRQGHRAARRGARAAARGVSAGQDPARAPRYAPLPDCPECPDASSGCIEGRAVASRPIALSAPFVGVYRRAAGRESPWRCLR